MPAGMCGANKHDSALDTFLRAFADKYKKDESEWAEKYGTNFENEKFMMHSFCWCDRDDCPWCAGITPRDRTIEDDEYPESAPNFFYKPLDFKVWWYKYIGRSVEVNKELTESEFKQMVLDSNIF